MATIIEHCHKRVAQSGVVKAFDGSVLPLAAILFGEPCADEWVVGALFNAGQHLLGVA